MYCVLTCRIRTDCPNLQDYNQSLLGADDSSSKVVPDSDNHGKI